MKTTNKLLFLLFIAATVTVSSSFTPGKDKGERLSMFQTYNDFMKGTPTSYYDDCTIEEFTFDATINGQKVKQAEWKDDDDFGFQDSKGFKWRLILQKDKSKAAVRVLVTGKIWLYETQDPDITKDANGGYHLKSIKDSYVTFESTVYIQQGVDGDFEECSEKNLKNFFADDPDLVAKVKAIGIHDKIILYKNHSWEDDMVNVQSWVNEYNNKHK